MKHETIHCSICEGEITEYRSCECGMTMRDFKEMMESDNELTREIEGVEN